jgi:hypothetical protein
MKLLLSAFGVLASLGFIAGSGLMNWHYWSSHSESDVLLAGVVSSSMILGLVSLCVDVFKCTLPFYIAWAWKAGNYPHVKIASVFFAGCLAFSFISAMGFAASSRGLAAGGREALAERLAGAEKDKLAAEAKRGDLGAHRASAVIEQALNGIRQDRRYTGSESCANATGLSAREFCKSYFAVKAELAGAVEDDRLSQRIDELGREILTLRRKGAGQDNDPQAKMLSSLLGLQVDLGSKVMNVFLALLVETGAAFGLYLSTGHGFGGKRERRQEAAKPVEPVIVKRVVDEPVVEAQVVRLPAPKRKGRAKAAQGLLRLAYDGNGELIVED